MSRRRRVLRGLIVATLAPATTIGPAVLPAHAAAPIRIPLHTGTAGASLLGVSETGLAVAQGRTVYSGAWGSALVPRPQAGDAPSGVDLVGRTLAYGSLVTSRVDHWTQARRLDILTGADVTDELGSMTSRLGFTGDGWLAVDQPDYLSGPIHRYPLGGGGPGTVVWSPDGKQLVDSAADARGLLVTYREYRAGDEHWKPTGDYVIDLIDLGSGAARTVSRGGTAVTEVTLSDDRIAWLTSGDDDRTTVWSVGRGGGEPTHVTVSGAGNGIGAKGGVGVDPSGPRITADGTVGYLVEDPADGRTLALRIVRKGKIGDVAVPAGSSGLDVLGNDFYTATGGTASVAGVYRISAAGRSSRVLTLPRPEREVTNWSFDHGVLRYLDRSGADELALWTRKVNDADGTPAVLAESAKPVRLRDLTGGTQDPEMSFDAGRGAVPSQKYLMTWDLLDRGRKTGVAVEQAPVPNAAGELVQVPGKPSVSGAYVLLSGLVHRADGELIATEPDAARQAGKDALFGSRLVYGLVTPQHEAEVWSVDTENPEPYRLASASCDRAPETTVWGRLSAWTSCDGRSITIGRSVGGGTPRTVPSGLTGPVTDLGLTMHGTALGWVANGTAYLLDLSRTASSPVALAGPTRRIVIDGHSVVREVHRDNAVPATVLQVEPLPFTSRPAPVLTGRVTRLGFTPDGDGRNDTWSAQFDASAPLTGASIRFVSLRSGVPARTLITRKVTDGSIRMVWTGRTSTGKKAPRGRYSWTLTARDTANRRLTATGTVEIG